MQRLYQAVGVALLAALPAAAFDLRGFISNELAVGRTHIVVPPGRYRVEPEHGRHLIFRQLSGIEIVASNVEMVCGATVQAVGFEGCTNVTLRGLTIDYDPLPFTQGHITALAPDKAWLEFEIGAGYPDHDLEERIEIYDPATGELRRETTRWTPGFERIGERRYRVQKHEGYRFSEERDTEQVGDVLVTNHRHPERAGGHAIVASHCTALTLEDVTIYASPCFAFLEHDCDASTYRRCRVDRRTLADDPVPRAHPRMRSLNADAFHSTGAARGPALLGCIAKYMGDDAVNIHGTYHYVAASRSNTLRIAVQRELTIRPGDPVEFLPYTGARPPDAVAVRAEPDAPITETEKDFVRRLRMHEEHRQRLLAGDAKFFTLTLDREVPLPEGSAVCSGNRVGNGFAVKDCDFGYNRSRGILIKASRGEVAGNRITHGWMAAVLVSPEFWWFEAASASDVVIRDNIITGCRRTAIEVVAPGGDGRPLPAGAHRNITITGNRVTGSPWPALRVTSTAGLRIRDNVWGDPLPAGGTPASLELCSDVEGPP